jgi:hypothetical protein
VAARHPIAALRKGVVQRVQLARPPSRALLIGNDDDNDDDVDDDHASNS